LIYVDEIIYTKGRALMFTMTFYRVVFQTQQGHIRFSDCIFFYLNT